MSEPMRIHRALARAGIASRRHAESLIVAGRVLVNGVAARVGQSIDPAKDRVQVDGTEVSLAQVRQRWIVLNKPAGVMTTRRDPEGRKTVFALVPDVAGLTYVGRLDFLTEGVLLMTTDGDAAHRLTHPSSEVERVYLATVRGNAKAAADNARKGVELDDGVVTPAWVNVLPMENRRWAFEVAIREGRTREVRRLCAALGLEVERLVRTQFGPVHLGKLAPGEWRELNGREAGALEALTNSEIEVPRLTPSQLRKARERRDRARGANEAPGAGSSRGERPRRGERGERGRGRPGTLGDKHVARGEREGRGPARRGGEGTSAERDGAAPARGARVRGNRGGTAPRGAGPSSERPPRKRLSGGTASRTPPATPSPQGAPRRKSS